MILRDLTTRVENRVSKVLTRQSQFETVKKLNLVLWVRTVHEFLWPVGVKMPKLKLQKESGDKKRVRLQVFLDKDDYDLLVQDAKKNSTKASIRGRYLLTKGLKESNPRGVLSRLMSLEEENELLHKKLDALLQMTKLAAVNSLLDEAQRKKSKQLEKTLATCDWLIEKART